MEEKVNIEIKEVEIEDEMPEIRITTKLEFLQNNYYYHEIIKQTDKTVHYIVEDLEFNSEEESDQFMYMKQIFFKTEEEYIFYKNYYKRLQVYCQTPFIKNDIAKLKQFFELSLDFQNYFEMVILFELGEADRIDINKIEKNQITAFLKNICVLLSDLKKIQNLYHGNIFLKNIVVVKGDLKLSGFSPIYNKSESLPSWILEISAKYGNFRLDIYLLGLLWLRFFNFNIEPLIVDNSTLENVSKSVDQVLDLMEQDNGLEIIKKMLDLENNKDLTIEIILRDFDESFVLENYDNYKIDLTENYDFVGSMRNSKKISKNNSKNENLFFEEYNSNYSNFNSDVLKKNSTVSKKGIGNFLQFEQNYNNEDGNNIEDIMMRGTFGGEREERLIHEIQKFANNEKKKNEAKAIPDNNPKKELIDICDDTDSGRNSIEYKSIIKVFVHNKKGSLEKLIKLSNNKIENIEEKIVLFDNEDEMDKKVDEFYKKGDKSDNILIFLNDCLQIFDQGKKKPFDFGQIKEPNKEKSSKNGPIKKYTFSQENENNDKLNLDEDSFFESDIKTSDLIKIAKFEIDVEENVKNNIIEDYNQTESIKKFINEADLIDSKNKSKTNKFENFKNDNNGEENDFDQKITSKTTTKVLHDLDNENEVANLIITNQINKINNDDLPSVDESGQVMRKNVKPIIKKNGNDTHQKVLDVNKKTTKTNDHLKHDKILNKNTPNVGIKKTEPINDSEIIPKPINEMSEEDDNKFVKKPNKNQLIKDKNKNDDNETKIKGIENSKKNQNNETKSKKLKEDKEIDAKSKNPKIKKPKLIGEKNNDRKKTNNDQLKISPQNVQKKKPLKNEINKDREKLELKNKIEKNNSLLDTENKKVISKYEEQSKSKKIQKGNKKESIPKATEIKKSETLIKQKIDSKDELKKEEDFKSFKKGGKNFDISSDNKFDIPTQIIEVNHSQHKQHSISLLENPTEFQNFIKNNNEQQQQQPNVFNEKKRLEDDKNQPLENKISHKKNERQISVKTQNKKEPQQLRKKSYPAPNKKDITKNKTPLKNKLHPIIIPEVTIVKNIDQNKSTDRIRKHSKINHSKNPEVGIETNVDQNIRNDIIRTPSKTIQSKIFEKKSNNKNDTLNTSLNPDTKNFAKETSKTVRNLENSFTNKKKVLKSPIRKQSSKSPIKKTISRSPIKIKEVLKSPIKKKEVLKNNLPISTPSKIFEKKNNPHVAIINTPSKINEKLKSKAPKNFSRNLSRSKDKKSIPKNKSLIKVDQTKEKDKAKDISKQKKKKKKTKSETDNNDEIIKHNKDDDKDKDKGNLGEKNSENDKNNNHNNNVHEDNKDHQDKDMDYNDKTNPDTNLENIETKDLQVENSKDIINDQTTDNKFNEKNIINNDIENKEKVDKIEENVDKDINLNEKSMNKGKISQPIKNRKSIQKENEKKPIRTKISPKNKQFLNQDKKQKSIDLIHKINPKHSKILTHIKDLNRDDENTIKKKYRSPDLNKYKKIKSNKKSLKNLIGKSFSPKKNKLGQISDIKKKFLKSLSPKSYNERDNMFYYNQELNNKNIPFKAIFKKIKNSNLAKEENDNHNYFNKKGLKDLIRDKSNYNYKFNYYLPMIKNKFHKSQEILKPEKTSFKDLEKADNKNFQKSLKNIYNIENKPFEIKNKILENSLRVNISIEDAPKIESFSIPKSNQDQNNLKKNELKEANLINFFKPTQSLNIIDDIPTSNIIQSKKSSAMQNQEKNKRSSLQFQNMDPISYKTKKNNMGNNEDDLFYFEPYKKNINDLPGIIDYKRLLKHKNIISSTSKGEKDEIFFNINSNEYEIPIKFDYLGTIKKTPKQDKPEKTPIFENNREIKQTKNNSNPKKKKSLIKTSKSVPKLVKEQKIEKNEKLNKNVNLIINLLSENKINNPNEYIANISNKYSGLKQIEMLKLAAIIFRKQNNLEKSQEMLADGLNLINQEDNLQEIEKRDNLKRELLCTSASNYLVMNNPKEAFNLIDNEIFHDQSKNDIYFYILAAETCDRLKNYEQSLKNLKIILNFYFVERLENTDINEFKGITEKIILIYLKIGDFLQMASFYDYLILAIQKLFTESKNNLFYSLYIEIIFWILEILYLNKNRNFMDYLLYRLIDRDKIKIELLDLDRKIFLSRLYFEFSQLINNNIRQNQNESLNKYQKETYIIFLLEALKIISIEKTQIQEVLFLRYLIKFKLGLYYKNTKNYFLSKNYFENCLVLFSKLKETKHSEKIAICYYLGVVLYKMKDVKNAQIFFESLLNEILDKKLIKRNFKYLIKISFFLENFAESQKYSKLLFELKQNEVSCKYLVIYLIAMIRNNSNQERIIVEINLLKRRFFKNKGILIFIEKLMTLITQNKIYIESINLFEEFQSINDSNVDLAYITNICRNICFVYSKFVCLNKKEENYQITLNEILENNKLVENFDLLSFLRSVFLFFCYYLEFLSRSNRSQNCDKFYYLFKFLKNKDIINFTNLSIINNNKDAKNKTNNKKIKWNDLISSWNLEKKIYCICNKKIGSVILSSKTENTEILNLIEEFFSQIKNLLFLNMTDKIITYYNEFNKIGTEKQYKLTKFNYLPNLFNFYTKSEKSGVFNRKAFNKILEDIINEEICVHDYEMIFLFLEAFRDNNYIETAIFYLHQNFWELSKYLFHELFFDNFKNKYKLIIEDFLNFSKRPNFGIIENTPLIHNLKSSEILKIEKKETYHFFHKFRYFSLIDKNLEDIFKLYFSETEIMNFKVQFEFYSIFIKLIRKQSDYLLILNHFQDKILYFLHLYQNKVLNVDYIFYSFLSLVYLLNNSISQNEISRKIFSILKMLFDHSQIQHHNDFIIISDFIGNIFFKFSLFELSFEIKNMTKFLFQNDVNKIIILPNFLKADFIKELKYNLSAYLLMISIYLKNQTNATNFFEIISRIKTKKLFTKIEIIFLQIEYYKFMGNFKKSDILLSNIERKIEKLQDFSKNLFRAIYYKHKAELNNPTFSDKRKVSIEEVHNTLKVENDL